MWHRPRRSADAVASWQHAKTQYAALAVENSALRTDLRNARAARDQAIDLVRELQAAIMERNKADGDLHHLRRERDIVRAQAVEHDPTRPLH
jgi:hypothetical protein